MIPHLQCLVTVPSIQPTPSSFLREVTRIRRTAITVRELGLRVQAQQDNGLGQDIKKIEKEGLLLFDDSRPFIFNFSF